MKLSCLGGEYGNTFSPHMNNHLWKTFIFLDSHFTPTPPCTGSIFSEIHVRLTYLQWQSGKQKVRTPYFIKEQVVSNSQERRHDIPDTGQQSQRVHRPSPSCCPAVFEGGWIRGVYFCSLQGQSDVFLTEISPPGPLESRRTVSWNWGGQPAEHEYAVFLSEKTACSQTYRPPATIVWQQGIHAGQRSGHGFSVAAFSLAWFQQRAVLQCFGGSNHRRLRGAVIPGQCVSPCIVKECVPETSQKTFGTA